MPKLQRNIGLFALTLYGLGDILGSGIYGLIGHAAGELGNFVWLAFLVSFAVALMTGLCYAALGSRYPRAAGSSFIIWKAFGNPFLAFVAGLATIASGLTSMAAAANIFAGYFGGLFAMVPLWAGVVGFCFILSGIVFAGIRESMMVNILFTFIESAGLLLVIAAGLPYLGQVDLLDVQSIPNGASLTPSLILTGAVLTFYSFIGFEDVLNVSEEVIEPKRTVPLGLVMALLIASGIYMLVAVVAVSVVPALKLGSSNEPLVEVIRVAWPWFPAKIFNVIALCAVFNTALLNYVMVSRLMYGLGRLGLLPPVVSKVHKTTKTPYVAIAVTLSGLLVLALIGDIGSLARATSLFVLIVFMCMNAGLFLFQWREKGERTDPHHWRLPQIVPVLGVIGAIVMMFHAEAADFKIAGTLLFVILLLYILRRPTAAQIEKMESAHDPN